MNPWSMYNTGKGTSQRLTHAIERRSSRVALLGYRLVSSPRAVAVTVLLVYGVWISLILILHSSPYTFVNPGRHYIQLANQHGIKVLPAPSRYGGTAANPSVYGYDGQFTYYIALHPASAKYLLDVPWYRYQRILEPLLIKALSWGYPALIPWLMLAVSWLAVVVGTWAIASWLSTNGRQPGWALLYGFWPGLIVAVRNDLTDGVAYGLVAVAILLLDSPRSRPTLSALVIGLAVFARQEVAIYAAMMALGIGLGVLPRTRSPANRPLHHRLIGALKFVSIAFGPFFIYLILLSHWLRSFPSQISVPRSVPAPEMTADILMLILPAIIGVYAFWPSRFKVRSRETWGWSTYSVHVVALTGFMVVGQAGVYYSWSFSTVFRYYIPVVLGALVCYGCANQRTRVRSAVLLLCGGISMVAFPILAATGL